MTNFQRCDLVGWNIEKDKTELGIFWNDTPNFYSGKQLILYPSNKMIPFTEKEFFPIQDKDLINSYLNELKKLNKISQKYEIAKRLDENGNIIYSLSGWTIPGSYQGVRKPDWDNDLIGCPSQCYCKFLDLDKNKIYCIYLRWRWNDPWSSELIPCQEDGELSYSKQDDWIYIETKRDYSEPEHEKLQRETVKWVKKNYSNILWLATKFQYD